MTSDDDGTRKRELIDRAHAQAAKWQHELERGRMGVPDAPSVARSRREFHAAVLAYWSEIKRFRQQAHIEEQWNEDIPELGGSLDDITKRRLSEVHTKVTEKDPDTGAERVVSSSEPWVMDPQTAAAVKDKLEECAHELGFDADPERRAETTGTSNEALQEHLNTEVDIGHGDD